MIPATRQDLVPQRPEAGTEDPSPGYVCSGVTQQASCWSNSSLHKAGLQDVREPAHLAERTPSLHVEPLAPQMPPQQTSPALQQMLPHFNAPCAQQIPL